jgi:peptidoglycan lytic transglycosylase F
MMRHRPASAGLLALVPLLAACGREPTRAPPPASDGYIETGDIDALLARGKGRFAKVARAHLDDLPQLRWTSPSEDGLARAFADRVGLDLEVIEFPTEEAAVAALVAGRVDGIVGRKGVGIAPLPEGVAMSVPFRSEPGVFVSRKGEAPTSVAGLTGRTVTFGTGDGMAGYAAELRKANPAVLVDTIDAVTVEDVVDRIASGDIDMTLAERWVAKAIVEVHPELETGLEFGTVLYGAAVRATNPQLLDLLNDFAFQVLPVGVDAPPLFGDLGEIRDRRTLRVLTVNGPSSYYVYKGELVGFDLELIRKFAREQGLMLQMVVAPSVEDLVPWLRDGRGDVIGAGVIPPVLPDTAGIAFTREYHEVRPLVVARKGLGVHGEHDLAGLRAVVPRNSPYLPLIQARREALKFRLTITGDTESPDQLLDRLEAGEADVTIIPSHLAEAAMIGRNGLEVAYAYKAARGRSWAARDDQPALLAALDAFLDREVHGLDYAVLVRKYFRPDTRRVIPPDLRNDGALSPWDTPTRTLSESEGLDWRLVTAQMFVESRFDPRARSPVGAVGLMQMMPATARDMGVDDITQPHEQIRAGVAYLRWLYDRLPSRIELADRLAFAFAAYNAGFGHLRDARMVAARTGLDPDRWSDNVEKAMLTLSRPDVYRTVQYGYVNGREPVRYVRMIRELGEMYFRLVPQ